jgi:hypothetical protein
VSTALCLNEEAPLSAPFVRCWSETGAPLPLRVIRAPAGKKGPDALRLGSLTSFSEERAPAPPWLESGSEGKAFDFCGHVQRLCADIVARCASLRHIDISRVLFAVTQARSHRSHGLQARVTPLRFPEGRLVRRRRGTFYQVQRYFISDREMLYVVTFCLPRFLEQDFDDKLITLFHELYHISPAFDGDLRRQKGRYAIHSRSKRGYDEHMADLARAYLSDGARPSLHAFLRLSFEQLQKRHGHIVGIVVPRPKLIPIPARK